jgi:hypothetical protein
MDLIRLLDALPPNTLVYTVLLAVIIAPWIYSWRLRVRRVMVRLAWISVGIAVGLSL